jgi:hypothetical protein
MLTLLVFLWILSPVHAQEVAKDEEVKKEKKEKSFDKSQVLKWNPLSIKFGKISMFGEYNYRPKRSITLGIGIPFDYQNEYTINDDRQDVTTQTPSVMAGYRMYMGKKPVSGFYFEPYLKYLKNDIESFIFTDLDNDPVIFRATSKYSGFGVGAQLGVQFMIAKRVALDLFFLGPEANLSKVNFEARDISSSSWDSQDAAEAEQKIKDIVNDIPVIGDNIKIDVDASTRRVKADYNGFLPGIRAGISVGVRF